MNLLFRADANAQIGSGHVMRCLALAQAWRDASESSASESSGGRAMFLMAAGAAGLETRLRAEQMEVVELQAPVGGSEDAARTIEAARCCDANWVVIDGYNFAPDYVWCLRKAGLRVLALDDMGLAWCRDADIVLNQNLHAREEMYRVRATHTRLLLGTRFALLRREFRSWRHRSWRQWPREIDGQARRVLVTMGGSDPGNATEKVLSALQLVIDNGVKLEATIVIGSGNARGEVLRCMSTHVAAKAGANGAASVQVLQDVRDEMPALMARADVAIAASGSTSWELAFMGLPSLLVVTADNQRALAEEMETAGAAINCGWHEDLEPARLAAMLQSLFDDANRRKKMSDAGRALVDGLGAERVRACLNEEVSLRLANESDCETVWRWANDPDVRAASLSPSFIPWEEHRQWFAAKLVDPHHLFFVVVEPNLGPIGQLRIDLHNNEGVITYSVEALYRGKGYGTAMLSQASEYYFSIGETVPLTALVKLNNAASARAFAKAGFEEHEEKLNMDGECYVKFSKKR